MISAEIFIELREDHAEADNLLNIQLALLTTMFHVFRMLSIISKTLFYWLYVSVILSTNAKHYSQS